MTSCKLIIKNVRKNIRDYLIYFLTLMISVSVFYAFNSISDQPAFSEMGMTKTLLYDQLGILLSTLTVLIAVVLAFLIIYANQGPHFQDICRGNVLRWGDCACDRPMPWRCVIAGNILSRFKTVCY